MKLSNKIVLVLIVMTFSKSLLAEMIFGVHPYLSKEKLEIKFKPLISIVSDRLNIPIKLVVSPSYDSHIEAIGEGKYDFAFAGPVSYVKVLQKYGEIPLLGRLEVRGKPYFQGKIVTRLDSSISTLTDLKGKTVAFGNKSSTMSYLVPRYSMSKAGIEIEDLASYEFVGSHDKVAQSVIEGKFDVGAVKEAVFFKNYSQLKALTTTDSISEHVFVANVQLDKSVFKTLQNTLLTLQKDLKGKRALRKIKREITSIVGATADDYDNLKIILQKY